MLLSQTYPKLRSELRRTPKNEPAAHRELSRALGASSWRARLQDGFVSQPPELSRTHPPNSVAFPGPNFGSASSVSFQDVMSAHPTTNLNYSKHDTAYPRHHAQQQVPALASRPLAGTACTEARPRPRASAWRRPRPHRPCRRICSRPSVRPACFAAAIPRDRAQEEAERGAHGVPLRLARAVKRGAA